MEERIVTISRARFTVEYPASFQLVAVINPFPTKHLTEAIQYRSLDRERGEIDETLWMGKIQWRSMMR
jgi:predicted ATPase with chaperone activity